MTFLRIPFFEAIADAKTILFAGAGGCFDIFFRPSALLRPEKHGQNGPPRQPVLLAST